MTHQDTTEKDLNWLHHVAGTCGPLCAYCSNLLPHEPYMALSFPSSASHVANHDHFRQLQPVATISEGVKSMLADGIDFDDRAFLALHAQGDQTVSASAYGVLPIPIRGYQGRNEIHQSMESQSQHVELTDMYSINPPSHSSGVRLNTVSGSEVIGPFGLECQSFGDALSTPNTDLPENALSTTLFQLPQGWPLTTSRPDPPIIDTNSIIRYVPTMGSFVFICREPNCHGRSFGRWQEFARHYNGAHAPADAGNMFWCAVPGCDRGVRPFPRKDKLNDHIRKVHTSVVETTSSD